MKKQQMEHNFVASLGIPNTHYYYYFGINKRCETL